MSAAHALRKHSAHCRLSEVQLGGGEPGGEQPGQAEVLAGLAAEEVGLETLGKIDVHSWCGGQAGAGARQQLRLASRYEQLCRCVQPAFLCWCTNARGHPARPPPTAG